MKAVEVIAMFRPDAVETELSVHSCIMNKILSVARHSRKLEDAMAGTGWNQLTTAKRSRVMDRLVHDGYKIDLGPKSTWTINW